VAHLLQDAVFLCYRIFDIANEVELERARQLVAESTRRLKLTRPGSEYLLMPNPPLGIELGRRPLAMKTGTVEVECLARLFDHGAASIQLRVPMPGAKSFSDLVPIADELFDSQAVEALCLELVNGLRRAVEPALQGPHLWEQNESYTVLFVRRIEGDASTSALLADPDLPRCLLGESERLGVRQKAEVLQSAFSYSDNDLAIVDWNGAFVYEPSGSFDIPDVLEVCNAQLLELRYYDDLLDLNLRKTYDALERRRLKPSLFGSSYKPLARRVLVTLLDLSELLERVENSLKIIGDFYLARVYEAALLRLRVRAWQLAVTDKQRTLQNVYELIKSQVDTARSLSIEVMIALLIITELVVALLALKH
jgi:hypothetical protein